MSVVKINAITVTDGRGDELEKRFADRAGEIEHMAGFEGFELLRPVSGETRWFVYTRWASEEHFQQWVQSDAFQRGHARTRSEPVAAHADLLAFEVALKAEPSPVEADG
jgi:heme-degrading monooxygenase HmoA